MRSASTPGRNRWTSIRFCSPEQCSLPRNRRAVGGRCLADTLDGPILLLGCHNRWFLPRWPMTSQQLYYDVAKSHIQSQDAVHRDLETKALRLTTASLAIVGLLVALVSSSGLRIEEWWTKLPAVTIVICVGASAILTFRTLWTRDFHLNPRLDEFASFLSDEEYKGKGDEYWLGWVGKALRLAHEHNDKIVEEKWLLVKWNQVATLALLFPSFVLVALALTAPISSSGLPESAVQG